MKINKKEALALAKVLHQHTGSTLAIAPQSEHDETIHALQARLDRFIMVDGADADHVDDDFRPKASPAKRQAQPCDFFSDEEDDAEEEEDIDDEVDDEDDDEDEDCDDDVEQHDRTVDGEDLHALKPATSKDGALEFERVKGQVDLLVGGEPAVEDVTYVKRTGRALEVKASDGGWTGFEVSKFPKGWASLLPAGDLAMVEC